MSLILFSDVLMVLLSRFTTSTRMIWRAWGDDERMYNGGTNKDEVDGIIVALFLVWCVIDWTL